MAASETKPRRMKIATRCTSVEDFIWTFSKYVDDRSIFIATRTPKPVGTVRPFALLLDDRETIVMEGVGEVIESIETDATDAASAASESAPGGVGGMRLRPIELDEKSRALFDRLLDRRAAMQAERPATEPPPPAPEPPPRLLLVAQRFEDLTDDALAAFLECTLFEERGSLPSLGSSPEFSLARHSGEVRVLPVLVNDPAPIPPLAPPPEMTEQAAVPAPVFGPAPAPRPAPPRESEIAPPVAPPPSPPPEAPPDPVVAPQPSPPPQPPPSPPPPAPSPPPEPPRQVAPEPLPPLVPPQPMMPPLDQGSSQRLFRAVIFGLSVGLIASIIVIVLRFTKRAERRDDVATSQPAANVIPPRRGANDPPKSSALPSASAAPRSKPLDCVITVGSSPQRAKVSWNGREIGSTPLLDAKIPCEKGKLTVALENYETAEEELEAIEGTKLRAFKRLVPAPLPRR